MKETILLSALGFAGFEGLRIYKKLVDDNEDPIPSHKGWYFPTILWLVVFSGLIVWAFGIENRGLALYIGFSLPCSLKAFMKERLIGESIVVDDTERPVNKPAQERSVRPKGYTNWLRLYFRF